MSYFEAKIYNQNLNYGHIASIFGSAYNNSEFMSKRLVLLCLVC